MSATRQQKLSAFRLQEYGPDGPSLRTLRKWCEAGDLPARKHKPRALKHRPCLRKLCPQCGAGTYLT